MLGVIHLWVQDSCDQYIGVSDSVKKQGQRGNFIKECGTIPFLQSQNDTEFSATLKLDGQRQKNLIAGKINTFPMKVRK
ncbi:hypothetical protein PSI14_17695 [Xenorhabdus sp. XENO-2]|uniref:Uncharacterized protein n=1 Tax=Xenorhabdus anantnagensis TaxID=3025875 RepID=A0ABT5LW14_9GAMM|nr:hypothetical protein [Xenorhabdus anantnagensis]